MTAGRPRRVLSDARLDGIPADVRSDLERYLNQGGLLGTVTYALVDSGLPDTLERVVDDHEAEMVSHAR